MENILITPWATLSSEHHMRLIRKSLKTTGIFGLSNIPNLSNTIKQFADTVKTFFQQPESEKQKIEGYTAEEEICQDHILDYKKEYYDYYYDSDDLIPKKLQAYLNLTDILLSVTQKVLPLLLSSNDEKDSSYNNICRPLVRVSHYRSDDKFFDRDHCNWRNAQFDPGFITASIPALYFNGQYRLINQPIDQPKHTGLFVNPVGCSFFMPVPHQSDVIYFQAGQLLQTATKGQIPATRFMIRRPPVPNNIPIRERPKRCIDRFCMELHVKTISPILFD